MGKLWLWSIHNGKNAIIPRVPPDRLLNEKQNQGRQEFAK